MNGFRRAMAVCNERIVLASLIEDTAVEHEDWALALDAQSVVTRWEIALYRLRKALYATRFA